MNNPNTWAELAAATNPADIKQRTQFYKDKKTGEEKSFKVSYIDARTVIERLNSVCPGEWHFQVKELKPPTKEYTKWVCTGTLTVCGVVQEDVGINDNEDAFDPPKSAVSDCLKRCGVHFGIGIDLYPGHGSDDGYSKPKPVQAAQKPASATKTPQGEQPQAETPKARYSTSGLREAIMASINKRADQSPDDLVIVSVDKARKLAQTWRNIMEKKPVDLTADKARFAIVEYLIGRVPKDEKDAPSFKGLSVVEHTVLAAWLSNAPVARAEAKEVWAEIDTNTDHNRDDMSIGDDPNS